MRLSKIFVLAVLVGAVAVIGCSEDSGTGGSGGTAGTGGSAGTGGGGSGGAGGSVAEPCTEGLCVAGSEPETLCEDAIAFCNLQSAPTAAQCDEFGNVFCELDFGGAGGAGGDGGTGGDGGPGAADVCVFCETENQTAIDECVDAYDQCEDSLHECVVSALAACRTGRVAVFVTSETFDGDLGGLIGADEKCQAAADAVSLSGTYTAWISDNDLDARDRIRDGEYRLTSGALVANDKADLTDGSLSAAINATETPSNTVEGNVWTATDPSGVDPGVGSCQEWTTTDPEQSGRVGNCTATDATWTDLDPGGPQGGNTCEKVNRLYCFANTTSNP